MHRGFRPSANGFGPEALFLVDDGVARSEVSGGWARSSKLPAVITDWVGEEDSSRNKSMGDAATGM